MKSRYNRPRKSRRSKRKRSKSRRKPVRRSKSRRVKRSKSKRVKRSKSKRVKRSKSRRKLKGGSQQEQIITNFAQALLKTPKGWIVGEYEQFDPGTGRYKKLFWSGLDNLSRRWRNEQDVKNAIQASGQYRVGKFIPLSGYEYNSRLDGEGWFHGKYLEKRKKTNPVLRRPPTTKSGQTYRSQPGQPNAAGYILRPVPQPPESRQKTLFSKWLERPTNDNYDNYDNFDREFSERLERLQNPSPSRSRSNSGQDPLLERLERLQNPSPSRSRSGSIRSRSSSRNSAGSTQDQSTLHDFSRSNSSASFGN